MSDRLAEVNLSGLFHQDHGGDLLRSEVTVFAVVLDLNGGLAGLSFQTILKGLRNQSAQLSIHKNMPHTSTPDRVSPPVIDFASNEALRVEYGAFRIACSCVGFYSWRFSLL